MTGKLWLLCSVTGELLVLCSMTGKLLVLCSVTGKLLLLCNVTGKLLETDGAVCTVWLVNYQCCAVWLVNCYCCAVWLVNYSRLTGMCCSVKLVPYLKQWQVPLIQMQRKMTVVWHGACCTNEMRSHVLCDLDKYTAWPCPQLPVWQFSLSNSKLQSRLFLEYFSPT